MKVLVRDPGRIEFIGNHTDYKGGCALGGAVDRGIDVAMGVRAYGECRFISAGKGAGAPAG